MDKVQHFEIPLDNLDRAKKFYKDTFNWNMIDVPNMAYTMVHTGKTDDKGMIEEKGVINGGMIKRNNEIKSPVITITVDNIDHSLILAKKNGGKLLTDKTPVSDMGFMAYVKDSEGNIIGLWQNLKKY
ncbi:VOC family protein [Candidatus Pacearchaeota archaeon]|nr:VOC family protein [Candidatus Pacearchaeota archaeon]